jgi:sulfide:quinone oxidoreductase
LGDGSVRIKVIFPSSLEAAFGGAALYKELEAAFAKNGINVLYDIPVNGITETEVTSSAGHTIGYDLLMMVPPFRGHALFRHLEAADEFDFIEADAHMRVKGLDKTYAAGDITAFPGPKLAHMAARQAETAAANILAEIGGAEPKEVYHHEIAAIINAGGPDSIYLHYGIENGALHSLRKGKFWGWAKEAHDAFWKGRHS